LSDLPLQLTDSSTLLTVNKRLAAELRVRYDELQLAAGRTVWPSADILPWDAWLARLYEQLIDTGGTDRDLLSVTQERLLWQQVIERQTDTGNLLRPHAAAQSAQASAQLYADWRLAEHPLATLGGGETQTFLAWQRDFRQQLARRGQMTRADLLPLITEAFDDGRLQPPRRLVYSGFDTLSPAQQALFDTLASHGCDISGHAQERPRGRCRRITSTDGQDEIRMAAAWARQQTNAAPERRVAIVAPQIAQQKRDIQRIFAEVLTPSAYLQHSTAQYRFNISLGQPLADHPLIAHALLLLELLHGEQPLGSVGQLLRSPFVGGHSGEWEPRALFDAALRDDGLPMITVHRLRHRLAQFDTGDHRHCADLAGRIEKLLEQIRQLPPLDSPNAWVGHLQRLLGTAGWPGDAALDSHEYQQHERMQRVFSEFATLGKVRLQLGFGEAIRLLRSLAQEALFQPESVPARIQILGPLEAAGMSFDAIWLLGMHDQVWPPPPDPDPLLPSALQRELGMPHASAERELAFATALTARLVQSADELIASHAQLDGDRELRHSPLMATWPEIGADALGLPSDTRTFSGRPVDLEVLTAPRDTPATQQQAGGAGLLAAQANCPFQAVARFRLRATPLAEPVFAPDGALLGTLVHEILQRVWQLLENSERLAQLDSGQLSALIAPVARAAVDDIGRRRPDLFTPRFNALEARRLTSLAIDWLDVERTREQAFRVSSLERKHDIELAGLQLQTRADRVDELDDGTLAVIDYKTGRTVSNAGWFDERLTEPQLPLYCVDNDAPVSAALLARVRNDQKGCGYVGLSSSDTFAPGVTTPQDASGLDWQQTLDHWHRALTALAGEVIVGRADPTPSPQACEYCPLGALCRVRQSPGDAPAQPDNETAQHGANGGSDE